MDLSLFVQLLINGLLIGGIYALVSMGLTLIWGVMGVVNFAQGDFLMIGMYIAWLMYACFGFVPYVSVFICAGALFVFGLITQRFLISRVVELPMAARIYTTFGLSLFLTNLVLMVAGAQMRSIPSPGWVIRLAGLFVDVPRFISFLCATFSSIGLYFLLIKTKMGKALRAVSQDRVVASVMGIDVRRMYLIAFAIGAAYAGVAGALLMAYFYVEPTVGTSFMLSAFVAVVLGGMGNFIGAFFAGLIIGVAETLGGFFIGPGMKQAVSFVIFIIVLLVLPRGLFGKELGKERE
jgi:branched-chain amino acid transport system permease protein